MHYYPRKLKIKFHAFKQCILIQNKNNKIKKKFMHSYTYSSKIAKQKKIKF